MLRVVCFRQITPTGERILSFHSKKKIKLRSISSNAFLHILARASRPLSGLNDDLRLPLRLCRSVVKIRRKTSVKCVTLFEFHLIVR